MNFKSNYPEFGAHPPLGNQQEARAEIQTRAASAHMAAGTAGTAQK